MKKLKTWAAAAGLAALAAQTAVAAPVQWTTAAGGNGHYYEFIDAGLTWTEALAAAQSKVFQGMTGYLVTVTSAAENLFVSDTIAGGLNAWIGLSDLDNEGVFTWRSGPEAGMAPVFSIWSPNEPNNWRGEDPAGEHFVHTNWLRSGHWNDHTATKTFGYVAEYSAVPASNAVPEPTSLALMLGGVLAAGAVTRRHRGQMAA